MDSIREDEEGENLQAKSSKGVVDNPASRPQLTEYTNGEDSSQVQHAEITGMTSTEQENGIRYSSQRGEQTYGDEDAYADEQDSENQVRRTPDEGKGYIDEFSTDFINAEIFRLFDVESEGKISVEQLHICAKAMGWSALQRKSPVPNRSVEELLEQLDPTHDGMIEEEEFMLILKYIQQKRPSTLPPINPSDKSGEASTSTLCGSDKKQYGALLPRVGVYFLPDEKVLGLLK